MMGMVRELCTASPFDQNCELEALDEQNCFHRECVEHFSPQCMYIAIDNGMSQTDLLRM